MPTVHIPESTVETSVESLKKKSKNEPLQLVRTDASLCTCTNSPPLFENEANDASGRERPQKHIEHLIATFPILF
jgi:hypothetical protein